MSDSATALAGPDGSGGNAGKRSKHRSVEELGPNYKWIALSNTTLGMLIATINSSIVLIALPDIFKGIKLNPLDPSNTSYLLWMMMGFLVVTAVLVVSFGRLGDMYGRARMYNMGFAVFTVSSLFLAVTWFDGPAAATWLIAWRIVQGIGGAFLMANSSAILTDAFPANQRGLALGINGVAAIGGSFIGLLVGGVLAPINWNLIFLVSVPFGVIGTVWAYLKLHDTGVRIKAKMDWWGNITFAIGLVAVLVGITYGIQPYGSSSMGWGSPMVLSCIIGGLIVLAGFVVIEMKVPNPLFNLSLFKNKSFTWGNVANLMASLGRGGLQFILIIWLQGIWLPQHGYDYTRTPLWAGIYMVPMTIGFLLSAPVSGIISDKIGTKWFTSVGLLITAGTFGLLLAIPVDFNYWAFAAILLLNGIGMGMFASPNRAEVMNSLPPNARGSGAGMMTTFQNAAMVLSIGLFFSLMIAGLSKNLPSAMSSGLQANGVSAGQAAEVAGLPAVSILFAAFLGYNPIKELLGPHLGSLSQAQQDHLTGLDFFPHLISDPFHDGLVLAFIFAIVACLIGAGASLLTGGKKAVAGDHESLGAELASIAGESGWGPSELVSETLSNGQHAGPAVLTQAAGVENGAVTGRITVQDGAVAPKAVITVTGAGGAQIERIAVGADGSYAIRGLTPGKYTLIVSAAGFDPQAVGVNVDGSRAERRDFTLAGGGVLTGTVRSRTGSDAVTVVVTDQTGTVVAQAETGENGSFRIAGLPQGQLIVTAAAAAHQPETQVVQVELGTPSVVEMVLSTVGGLAGTVTDRDGAPFEGATVTAVDEHGSVVARSTTGADGRYRLDGLADGQYTVVVSAYQPAAVHVGVLAGQSNTVDVALRPAGELDAAAPVAGQSESAAKG